MLDRRWVQLPAEALIERFDHLDDVQRITAQVMHQVGAKRDVLPASPQAGGQHGYHLLLEAGAHKVVMCLSISAYWLKCADRVLLKLSW